MVHLYFVCDPFTVEQFNLRNYRAVLLPNLINLLMTDVPDQVRVAVVAPIGNSDHSSLSTLISMAQAVPNLSDSRKVLLKHQVNWNTVIGGIQSIHDLPRYNIWFAHNPVEVLNEHLCVLVGRYVPIKVIRVPKKDKPWFDDQGRHDQGSSSMDP